MPMTSPARFCLVHINLSFPVAISRTTYSDTYAAQVLQSCRNFGIFFAWIVTEDEIWRGKGSGRCLEVLLVNRLAVYGPYENEYFTAIWLLQATVYPLLGVIHVDNFQLHIWIKKLMLGCLDYWHSVDTIWPLILVANAAVNCLVSARIWSFLN